RALQLLTRWSRLPLACLGGEEEAVRISLQPGRHTQLCVAVAGSNVDVVDVVLDQHVEGVVGSLLVNAREGSGAEDDAAAQVSGASVRQVRYRHGGILRPAREGVHQARVKRSGVPRSASTFVILRPQPKNLTSHRDETWETNPAQDFEMRRRFCHSEA